MKDLTKDILFSLFVGMAVPGMILNYAAAVQEKLDHGSRIETAEPAAEVRTVWLPVKLLTEEGESEEADMDDYLVGVLLAEMPASFEMEALKAQAVVARTYARKAYLTGGKHGNGSVCRKAECCQGYVSEAAYLEKGGTAEGVEKIRRAVLATSGQVLIYDGELIEATYFSCSGGSTEDAQAVWGQEFPYLQSVESPGEEEAAHYRNSISFTQKELEVALGISLADDPQTWIGDVTYTAGGSVDTIVIGGTYFTGTEIRSVLNLPSASFEILPDEQGVTITTKGYGHRVGMSQYGADAMAAVGKTYQDILFHYYRGTALVQLSQNG